MILEGGERLEGSHLLVAAGRAPVVEGLDLDKAGIAHTAKGITVDASLRTTNRNVWAIGDCNGLYAFTHMAGYEASLFIRGALFRAPARLDASIVPWATYTDPELAQVGLSERQARDKHGDAIKVLRWKLAENDRAQTERTTEGMVKAITDRHGRILGATIAAPHAGELIQPWCLAIVQAPEDLGAGELRAALSDPGRGEQARRRQLLHRNAVRPAHALAGAVAGRASAGMVSTTMARPRIVIVGAGFGGLSAAQALAGADADVTRHRPAQLPSLPAAALSGGDGRPVAGADRRADPRHPAHGGQRAASCWAA